jgi:glycosyltransferase involved in cell wall biosynthesis
MKFPPKVSCIITSYNRFDLLQDCISSVYQAGYANLEIIVVNDGSDDPRYRSCASKDIQIVNLPSNSKTIFGYGSCGLVKNIGASVATGQYLAFLDDDDAWLPGKLSLQLNAMHRHECLMSCTDAYLGRQTYKEYKSKEKKPGLEKYNKEHYYPYLLSRFQANGSQALKDGFPGIWTKKLIEIHNLIIVSSVIMDRELFFQIGGMGYDRSKQDWMCWLEALKFTNCAYIDEPLVYYDDTHGGGRSW